MDDYHYDQGHKRRDLSGADWSSGPISTTLDTRATLSDRMDVFVDIDDPDDRQEDQIEAFLPPWVKPTIDRLGILLALPENWDSYGAASISFANVEYAFRLLGFIIGDDTPPPDVVPTSEGSIQIEWHEVGIDLEVEVLSPYRVHVSYKDRHHAGREWSDELTSDLTELKTAINELTRRTGTD